MRTRTRGSPSWRGQQRHYAGYVSARPNKVISNHLANGAGHTFLKGFRHTVQKPADASFRKRSSDPLCPGFPDHARRSPVCTEVYAWRETAKWTSIWTSSGRAMPVRSEEHTSELQSLMRISYDAFCLKTK